MLSAHPRGQSRRSAEEVASAPYGRTLAAPGSGDTVRLWDTTTGAGLTTPTADHQGRG